MDLSNEYTITLFKSDNTTVKTSGKIGTGDIIKVYVGSKLVDKYTISVKGDVTGDGILEINDILLVRGYILGSKQYQGNAYELAADYCNDTGVEINDFLKMRKDYLNNI